MEPSTDFIKIHKIDFDTVDMLDCTIDVKDKEMPIEIDECFTEFCRFFALDAHLIYIQIVKHVQDMLKLDDMVTDSDGNSLNADSDRVKAFFDNEKVKWALHDDDLFDYFYDQITNLDDNEKSGWTKYYDYPDLRVFYKDEEGETFGSIITDTIVDTNFDKLIAVWDNLEIFAKLMPEFYDIKFEKKFSNWKSIMTGKQQFPWPLYHRDMVFQITGFIDPVNKSCCTLQKSLPNNSRVMNYDCPPDEPSGMPRLEMTKGYHFFQALSETKARHVQVMSIDPKLDYMPKAVMDWMMNQVLYGNMKRMQQFCLDLENKEHENYIYFHRKLPYYNYCKSIFDDEKNLLVGRVGIDDCPEHPANPNSKDHDPTHFDFKGNLDIWYFGKDQLEC